MAKTQRQKTVRKIDKVSPKPNAVVGSVLGSYLIFGFCKKRVFLKRRKHNGSCWNVLRPVFSLRTRCAARSAFAKAGDRNGQPYVFKIKGWPFWWWMRNASKVSLRAVSEADSPGVSKELLKQIAEV